MRQKIETLARIERLRRRMHELAQWRLARVARERETLVAAHAQMIAALCDGLMAYGPPAAAGSRRVRAMELELARVNVVEKDMEQHTLDEGRLAKLADISLAAARGTWRDQVDRRSLEELIEVSVIQGSGPRKPDSGGS